MQPLGGKAAPSSRRVCAGRAGGGEAEGRSAVARSAEGQYVHTPIGTSHGQRFVGSTSAYIEKERNKRRFKHLMAVWCCLSKRGRGEAARGVMSCGGDLVRIHFSRAYSQLISHIRNPLFSSQLSH